MPQPHRGMAVLARLPRPTPQPPLHPTQTPLSLSLPPYSVILSEGAHSFTVSTGVEGPRRGPYHPYLHPERRCSQLHREHRSRRTPTHAVTNPYRPHLSHPKAHPTQTPPSLIPPILCHPERRCSQLHREHRSRRTPTQPVSPKPPTPFSPQSPPLRLRPKAPNTRSTTRTLGVLRLRRFALRSG
jgi:hypothetical protein